ncbi:MAG: DUF4440 domain-containing protein [Candidatus Paceibacterota bacterium]
MNDLTKTIYELELSLLKPEVRSSREALDKLLADDFIELGNSGNKYMKADILERLPNTLEKIQYVVSDFAIDTPSDNIVVATFKTERTTDGKEKVISLRSSHWRNNDGGWQMFFHHATPID